MRSDCFTAILTSHANPTGLTHMIGNLIYQTRPPDQVLAFCSDTPGLQELRELFPSVHLIAQPNLEDWGHSKRALGIQMANGDWLGFFNDDDSYDIRYVEKMMKAAGPGIDAVYCWWKPLCEEGCNFELGSSTSGNFIVRTSLAHSIEYPQSLVYESDGIFINAIRESARQILCVPEPLYHWNDPNVPRGG